MTFWFSRYKIQAFKGFEFILVRVICLQFPQTSVTMHMTHDERTKGLHTLLFQIVHQVFNMKLDYSIEGNFDKGFNLVIWKIGQS